MLGEASPRTLTSLKMTAIRIEHVLDATGLLQAIVGLARSRENGEARRGCPDADVVAAPAVVRERDRKFATRSPGTTTLGKSMLFSGDNAPV